MSKNYFQSLTLASILFASVGVMAQTKELSLREALQMAAVGNRQMQIRSLESNKAAEAVKEAKSYLLPTVTASSGYTVYGERPVIYLRNENTNPKLNDVKYGGRFALDGNFAANYPLLNAGLKSNIRLAGINERIQKEETMDTGEQLALQISQLYFTVLMKKEQALVLEQSLLRNEKALKDSRSLFLQGKNLKTDTLSNYISVQNLKASLSAIENSIRVMSVQLQQLMGVEGDMEFIFTDSLLETSGESAFQTSGAVLSIALDNRKDMKVQSLRIDHQREQLQNERAGFKPQIWAVAQYQVQAQADNSKFWAYGLPRTSFAGIRLTIPVYSGNRMKYKTAQSEFSIKQNELALAEIRSNIETEIISLTANMQEARNQYHIQKQNAEAALVNYTMMNDRYRYGLGSRLELTDAELGLTKAKLDNLQAIYSIRMIELQLKKAMGILQLN